MLKDEHYFKKRENTYKGLTGLQYKVYLENGDLFDVVFDPGSSRGIKEREDVMMNFTPMVVVVSVWLVGPSTHTWQLLLLVFIMLSESS